MNDLTASFPRRLRRSLPGVLGVAVFLSACGSSSSPAGGQTTPPPTRPGTSPSASASESALPTESPVPAESNPPGDIPDTTNFVRFHSTKGHFVVRTPEGWSRTTGSTTVTFTDKLNSVTATWSAASSAPTVSSVKSNQVPSLRSSERAFTLSHVLDCAPSCSIPYSTAPIDVHLTGGNAVVLTYQVNSAPNTVTGKQYRLEVVRFDFFQGSQEVDLVLSGPVGSDNVDPWRLVAQSFTWA